MSVFSSPAARGIAIVVGAMAIFTANDTLMKQVAAELTAMQVVFLRGLAATAVMGAIVAAGSARRSIAFLFDRTVTLRSLVEFVSISCFVVALARLPIGDVVAIAQTAPLILLPLAALIYRERIGPRRTILVLMGFAGALMVTQPGGAGFDPLLLSAFACAFAQSARDLLSRRVAAEIPARIVALSTVAVVCAAAGIGTLVTGWAPVAPWHILYSAGAGACLAIAHLMMFAAFRLAPISTIAPFFYSATLWAVLSGYTVFGERPDALTLAGIAVLVVSGVALARSRG